MRHVLCDGRTRTHLEIHGAHFMNDGPEEHADLLPLLEHARGRVLILGLGLGLELAELLPLPAVERVVVVEVFRDVIDLIGPRWASPKLEILEGNAFSYEPAGLFDAIWIDIWATVAGSYWPEVVRLRARYERFLAPGGWLGVWRGEAIRENARCEACGALEPSVTGTCAKCST